MFTLKLIRRHPDHLNQVCILEVRDCQGVSHQRYLPPHNAPMNITAGVLQSDGGTQHMIFYLVEEGSPAWPDKVGDATEGHGDQSYWHEAFLENAAGKTTQVFHPNRWMI